MDPTEDVFVGHFPFASSRPQDTWTLQDLTNLDLEELGGGGQSSTSGTGVNVEHSFIMVSSSFSADVDLLSICGS